MIHGFSFYYKYFLKNFVEKNIKNVCRYTTCLKKVHFFGGIKFESYRIGGKPKRGWKY